MGTQAPSPKGHSPSPISGPYLLWPNGSMDQDATRQEGRPRSKRHCVRWGPSSPLPKKGLGGRPRSKLHCLKWGPSSRPENGGTASPTFGPCLLWLNGCMDQDETWHGSRPRPRPHCVRWGPSSTSKGHSPPQFSAHVCCAVVSKQLDGSSDASTVISETVVDVCRIYYGRPM